MPTQPRHENPDALGAIAARIAAERADVLARIAWRRGARGEDVDDAVSQAFTDLLRFYTGGLSENQVWAYLATCLTTRVSKQRRTARRRDPWMRVDRNGEGEVRDAGEVHDGREQTDPLERAIEREEAERGAAFLDELPADQRAVILLGAAGYTPREIGERLGLTHRQIRKRVTKANARLRELRARDRD